MKARRRRPRPVQGGSRLSSHVRRDGQPKNPYRTRAEALAAAQLAWTLERVDLDAYRCEHCHQWHIGRHGREE